MSTHGDLTGIGFGEDAHGLQSAARDAQILRALAYLTPVEQEQVDALQPLAASYGELAPLSAFILNASPLERRLAAHAMHQTSVRAAQPFIVCDGARLSAELVNACTGATLYVDNFERIGDELQNELVTQLGGRPATFLIGSSPRGMAELQEGRFIKPELWAIFSSRLLKIPAQRGEAEAPSVMPFREAERHWQFLTLKHALGTTRGNKTKAARALQLSLTHFKRLCKQHPELARLDF